ncbi:MAG TPA: glycoside hydrolase family 88 protein [Opitutaceae bacterium]|jgi:unsaturated rhamnogalacturonyl hydrolase|nr:glycoside hydrolase family 88 protein [Opitutaceae bacterium]
MIVYRLQPVYATLACAALIAVLMAGCQSTAKDSAASNLPWPNEGEVRAHMQEVFRPELAAAQAEPKPAKQWPDAVFYMGVSAAWQATDDEDYHDALEQWGRSVNWSLGSRPRHADDMARGQVYLDLYAREGGPERIAAIRARVDAFLASPQPGHTDWSWCDSFFMAPPIFVKLSAATGDAHYREAMHPLFQDAIAALWDEPNHLFYRDRHLREKEPLVFWARGNGWVLAGLARVLEGLPAGDAALPRYEERFKTLAASIVKLQGEDGAWRADLLHPQRFPQPESSGTALLAYGLAWGVNHGLLSRADYAPAVLKAWAALKRMQLPDGQLGSVQPKGDRPAETKPADTGPYGGGAFLLLGSELLSPPATPPAG